MQEISHLFILERGQLFRSRTQWENALALSKKSDALKMCSKLKILKSLNFSRKRKHESQGTFFYN